MIRISLTLFFVLFLIDAANSKVKSIGFLPNAFEAEFDQVTTSLLTKREIRSKVIFKYSYKSNFFMKDAQNNGVYICNPKEFWYYQPSIIEGEKGTVSTGSTSRHCYSKFFDSLRGGLKNNKKYQVEKLGDAQYLLKFNEKEAKRLSIKELKLFFEGNERNFQNLSHFYIHWMDEKKPLKLEKKKISLKDSFPESTFKFKIPKNTTVQKLD